MIWPFKRKSRQPKPPVCDHDWNYRSCQTGQYAGTMEVRTLYSRICVKCGDKEAGVFVGWWTISDLNWKPPGGKS